MAIAEFSDIRNSQAAIKVPDWMPDPVFARSINHVVFAETIGRERHHPVDDGLADADTAEYVASISHQNSVTATSAGSVSIFTAHADFGTGQKRHSFQLGRATGTSVDPIWRIRANNAGLT